MSKAQRSVARAKHRRAGARSLQLEPLEGRRLLAVFTAGDANTLRADIATAANNGDATNTINLTAGTFSLMAASGELLIQDTSATVHAKTLSIIGAGAGASLIDGTSTTRDIEVLSSPGARWRSS